MSPSVADPRLLFLPAVGWAGHLHGRFTKKLDGLGWWLTQDDNAERAALLHLLDSIVGVHEQHQGDDETVASPADLRDAIATVRTVMFRGQLEVRHDAVEAAAVELLDHLESETFLGEFERLPVELQLHLMAELSDGLTDSAAGLSYLTHTVVQPLGDQPRPALHVSRLEDYEGSFLGDLSDAAKAAATTYAQAANNLLPSLFSARALTMPETVVVHTYVRFLERYYDIDVVQRHGYLVGFKPISKVRTVEQLHTAVFDLTAFNREQPQWLARLGAGASVVQSVVSVAASALTLHETIHRPDRRNTIGFGVAVLAAAEGVDIAIRAVRSQLGREVAEGALRRLASRAIVAADVALNAWDAAAAFREEKYWRATGHGLQGAAGIMMSIGFMKTKAGAATAWSPVGWALMAGGVACLLGGTALVVFTRDPPEHGLVTLFRHTYFGTDADEVDPDPDRSDLLEEPVPFVRWRNPDRSPNYAEQLNTFLSLMYSVNLVVAEKRRAEVVGGTQWRIRVRIEPELGLPGTYVWVRVFHRDDVHHARHFVLPLVPDGPVHFPWLATLDVWPSDLGEGGDEDARLEAWECQVLVDQEVWDDAWLVEVQLSPPTIVQNELLGEFTSPPDEVAAELTLAMLDRRPVTEAA